MKDLGYTDIFRKEHKHGDELRKDVEYGLVNILMDENKISEKSFSRIDELRVEVKSKITNEILENAENHFQSGKRMNLFYENLYDKLYFKNINEGMNHLSTYQLFEKR